MAIEPDMLAQLIAEEGQHLADGLAPYGDGADVIGVVLVAHLRLHPTEAEPVTSAQTHQRFVIAPDDPRVQAALLRAILDDARRQVPDEIAAIDTLPTLDA